MFNRQSLLCLAFCFLVLLSAAACHAKDKRPLAMPSDGFSIPPPAWTLEAWTADDKPYKQIEADIDKALSAHALDKGTLEAYRLAAEKDYRNPQTVFRWVYASYKGRRAVPPIPQANFPGPGVMDRVRPTHSYEYTRLRFLVQVEQGGFPTFRDVGERLLKHTPDDYVVRYYVITCIDPTVSASARHEALARAADLIRDYPQRPGPYLIRASVYYLLWYVHHSRSDGEQAIAGYQKYLSFKAAKPEKAAEIEGFIKEVTEGLKTSRTP